MPVPDPDRRSERRRLLDEQIAAEPQLPPPDLAPGSTPRPLEAYLAHRQCRPVAAMGIVENGLIRPLDPQFKLAERTRVIILSSEPGPAAAGIAT